MIYFYSEKPDFSHATENYPSLLAFLSAQTLWFLFVETGGGTGMLTGKSAATAEGRQSSGTSVHSALTRTQFSSVQSLIRVWLSAAPCTVARQASLSITNSWSLLKLVSMESWCHPTISSSIVPFSRLQSFPASGSFQMSQFFASGGQSSGVSASASVLPMNIQDWSSLGWTGWISLQSKGFSSVFSNTTVQKHQFFGAQLSL